MQGRLCDQVNGLIQAFPKDDWEKEFKIANSIDIQLMEWTLDYADLYQNPLMTIEGRAKINELKKRNNIKIESLTGDCFMQLPFWKSSGDEQKKLKKQFMQICEASNKIGIEKIVIPLVDNGSLINKNHEEELVNFLLNNLEFLKSLKIKIAFESDFSPLNLKSFISKFPINFFGINYDTGNSAAMGFDPAKEFASYGHRIMNIHLKDRILGGKTVHLGDGNVDFNSVFKELKKINYSQNYILQTARAPDRNHAELIKNYYYLICGFIKNHFGS